jgi:hypothetical protein
MQRDEPKKTKITIREDMPTSVASVAYGANVGGMAFNDEFIAHRDPELAIELIKLYEKAWALRDKPPLSNNDPRFTKASDKYIKFIKSKEVL